MKKLIFLIFLVIGKICPENHQVKKSTEASQKNDADWTVIGAGPAGIVVIGVLLDLGIPPQRISWIDPEFNVGRLSSYPTVIANTKNKSFLKFLSSCRTFANCETPSIKKLKLLDPEKEYNLQTIIDPLKEITDCLRTKVKSYKGCLDSLYFQNNAWMINVNKLNFSSYNVILATGSFPKTLDNYSHFRNKEIPLDQALNKSALAKLITKDDIVAVFGSSHSAILILKYLTELPVRQIINFYKSPIQYAIEIGNLQFNINGIKGTTATWAKKILERDQPENLIRLESRPEYLDKILPACTKIIYAIGFKPNKFLNVKDHPELTYNDKNGIIATRLFGIGIAFPEKHIEPLGEVEYKIGLKDFMEYAQKIVPGWMQTRSFKAKSKQQIELLSSFDKLFNIQVL